MAELDMNQFVTWTAYPSLISSLSDDSHRAALEEAACAHYCGRYRDAEAIFDSKLYELKLKPIVVLQRADMLTSQGLEHERISLLKLALQGLSTDEEDYESVQLLLNFMLADAELWAFGQTEAVMKLLPTLRSYLRSRGVQSLSDVEVILAFSSSISPVV